LGKSTDSPFPFHGNYESAIKTPTIRHEKKKTHHTSFVVRGNKINYPGKVATPTAEMLVAKLLFNSIISTHGAQFMTMDIANFYLRTPLKRPE
jgi:hypothetical protein